MKAIFILKSVHTSRIRSLIKNLDEKKGISSITYNHLFSGLVLEFDPLLINIIDLKDYLTSKKISYRILENINEITSLEKPKPPYKYSLVVLGLNFLGLALYQVNLNFIYLSIVANLIYFILVFYKNIFLIIERNLDDSLSYIISSLLAFLISLVYIGNIQTYIIFNFISLLIISTYILKDTYIVNLKDSLFKSLKKIIDILPDKATIKRNKDKMEVDVKDIKENDIIIAHKDTILPVDGVIIDGFTHVDQSLFTSEVPLVNKSVNHKVMAGEIHKEGYVEYRVTNIDDTRTLFIRNNLLLEACLSKSGLYKLIDLAKKYTLRSLALISLIFILGFLIFSRNLLGLFTYIITMVFALNFEFFEYLIPTSIFKYIVDLSKKGIIVKSSKAIEDLHECDLVFLEKSGIVCREVPDVKDVYISEGIVPSDFYQTAYFLVKNSSTPIAKSIKNYLKNIHLNTLDKDSLKVLTKIKYDSKTCKVGDIDYYKKHKIDISKLKPSLDKFIRQGKNPIIFMKNKQVIGIINLMDIINNEALDFIRYLQDEGKKIILLDSDRANVTKHIADKLNIDTYHSNMSTSSRINLINDYNLKGYKTMAIFTFDSIDYKARVNIAVNSNLNYNINPANIIISKQDITSIKDLIISSKDQVNILKNKIMAYIEILSLSMLVIAIILILI